MTAERYEVIKVVGDERRLLASAPDGAGAGLALVTLFGEGEFGPSDRVGILDRDLGKWVVNPYARPVGT